MNFQKSLDHLAEQVKLYRRTDVMDGEALNSILKEITATLSYLTGELTRYHDKYQNRKHELILSGTSVNKAEIISDVEIPEVYLLRRTIDSGYEVVGAIRTNISYIKSERANV